MNDRLTPQTPSAFQLQFTYRFEAAHRFTQSRAPSCMTPHGHTWNATAVFESLVPPEGDIAMVAEFGELKRGWKSFITETVDHSFLHHFEDPILPALRLEIPGFRGLPFPCDPTTEAIAVLFFAKLSALHAASSVGPRCHPRAMVIRETPVNRVVYRPPRNADHLPTWAAAEKSWWTSADPTDRLFANP